MITVEAFKSHFARDFPYLPYYNPDKIYFKDDVVYVEPNFYISKIDDNDKEVPLGTIEELKDLQDITFQGDFFMTTYIKYWD